ncbi:receptor activity-modifying protein 2 isoform X2 [Betta splendens]|uniref:Receptor activity-modifying protein 2 isoform X2 n=1 Tax=Betta splendens TaxID=158456 RepID=A0A6P7N591_BETSP|nr:receptor activity-modifying protein 2 isoform X2 [Betta splendens]
MKGALGFIGVFLSFLSEPTRGVTPEPFACGDATDRCPDICDLCQSLGQPSLDCLSTLNQHLCLANFVGAMGSLQSADRCSWGLVKVSYSNFSLCTEEMSDCLRIPWPNSQVERLFVDVHHEYFRDCPSEELSDPPEAVVFALAMTPICLIPIMVSLVVLKTKNGDGSS